MKSFKVSDRDESMVETISFHGVPMPRGLAFCIRHIENNGAPVSIFSADRRDRIIREHNKEFGTNLHGQVWLVSAHNRHPSRYAPANSPMTTSHCYRSDGNRVYRARGKQIPAGERLPWYMLGIDLADKGKVEDVSRFLKVARKLHYPFVQTYRSSGRELHHVNLTRSPIKELENSNQISKRRG